jgi:hypothetical protein
MPIYQFLKVRIDLVGRVGGDQINAARWQVFHLSGIFINDFMPGLHSQYPFRWGPYILIKNSGGA